jgi:glycerol-3-phosphate dehydrogenase
VPPLSVGDTASHAVYYEAATNDSRLALATVTAAARSGAVVANYLRAMDLDLAPGRISRVSLQGRRGEIAVRCRAVVNTTGPWLDLLRNMEDFACESVTRLSKGIHVVLRPDEQWRAAVAVSLEGGQHLYAVPCEDMILLGTTEQEYHGDPAAVAAEPEDVSYLLQVAGHFLRPRCCGASVSSPSSRGCASCQGGGSDAPCQPGAPDVWAQVYHAVGEEWALTAEDVIYRRTTLGLRGFDTPGIRQRISTVLEAGPQIPPPGLFEPTLRRVV